MDRPKKVLITGITGYLGSYLEDYLSPKVDKYLIWGTSRHHNIAPHIHGIDLLNREQVKIFMDYVKPDIIYHLAANSSGRLSMDDAFENLQTTHNIVRACPPGAKLVFASSSMVYPGNNDLHKENEFSWPDTPYGRSKRACEELVRNVHGISARLVGIIGPFMTHGVLLHIINKYKSQEDSVKIKNVFPGSHLQFIHITDAVRALVFLGESGVFGCMNISSCNLGVDLNEMTKIVSKELGIEKDVEWLGGEPTRHCLISNDGLKSLGFKFNYPSSETAIQATVESYK